MHEKYKFVDITIYIKGMDKNEYINLSDFQITTENGFTNFASEDKFLIGLGTHFTKLKGEIFVAPITLDELLALADIKDTQYINRVLRETSDEGEEFLAMLCAKKIRQYMHGKIIMTASSDDSYTYDFKRLKNKNRCRIYPTILTKKLINLYTSIRVTC